MAYRTDAEDTSHQRRHVLEAPPPADARQAPELAGVKAGLCHLALGVEADGDLGAVLEPWPLLCPGADPAAAHLLVTRRP